MENPAHLEISQLAGTMATVHLSFLLPFIDPWLFDACAFSDQLFDLIISAIGDSIEEDIFHSFVSNFFLKEAKLPTRKYTLMKWILYIKFISDYFEAIDKWIHVILFPTFFSFPSNSKEDLTSR